YVEALRSAWPEVPETSDFVMYWWHYAAQLTRQGALERFGFITTNSIRQTFNQRVVQPHLSDKKGALFLAFAIPDHPWVDGSDGAAVRIAMTVATREVATGILQTVVMEDAMEHGEFSIQLATQRGQIQSNLRVGANINSARPLIANRGICFQGVKLVGSGFRLDEATYMAQDKEDRPVLREYWTGRDVTARRVPEWVIDFFGME